MATLTLGGAEGSQNLIVQGKTITAALVNEGVVTVLGTCAFNGTFSNGSGATLQVQGSSSGGYANLTVASGFTNQGLIELTNNTTTYGATLSVSSGPLVNVGTIRSLPGVSGGTRNLNAALDNQGALLVDQALTINKVSASHTNSGTIDVSGGNLTVTQAGTTPSFTNTGTININAGRTLTVTGGTFVHDGTFTGSGILALNSSNTLKLAADLSLPIGGSIQLTPSSGLKVEGPGTLTNRQSLTLVSSTVNAALVNEGVVTVRGTCAFNGTFSNGSGATLQVQGSSSGGYANLTVASGFTNQGLIELTNNTTTYGATLSVSSGPLVNVGTIRSLPGVSGGTRNLNAALDNQGALLVDQALTINKGSASHTNSGTITMSGGQTLTLKSGTLLKANGKI